MRIDKILRIQRNLKQKQAYICFDKAYIEYILNVSDAHSLLITCYSHQAYINSTLKEKYFVPTGYNDVANNIISYCRNHKITTIFSDFTQIPFSIYKELKKARLNVTDVRDVFTINKVDLDLMKINLIILEQCLQDFMEYFTPGMKIRALVKRFRSMAFEYEVSDAFISITYDTNSTVKLDYIIEEDVMYMIDCGLKYKGCYSDITILKKIGDYAKEEIEIIEQLNTVSENIRKLLLILPPNQIYKKISSKFLLESGMGHTIDVHKHGNYSICSTENTLLPNNVFFTLEPILKFRNKNIKIEKMFVHIDSKIVNIKDNLRIVW
ncbi:MAG: M24 family metallopeptidase [Defluviitoga tunisiensis]|nr:M24 family metallopeptidase [Defluviitoga tunisiensis]